MGFPASTGAENVSTVLRKPIILVITIIYREKRTNKDGKTLLTMSGIKLSSESLRKKKPFLLFEGGGNEEGQVE